MTPPYAEKTHAGARTGGNKDGKDLAVSKLVHFDSITGEAFLKLCAEACRVAKRWVFMTCDWRHAALVEDAMPTEFVRLGVWVKPNPAPQFTGDRPGTGWEAVVILHRKGRKRWNGGGKSANWICNKENGNEHPTEKPLKLVREWVRLFTEPGELVLDPFAGSCTTALACLYEGRRCLAVEHNPDYVEMGRRKVAAPQSSDCLIRYVPRRNPAADPDLFS